MQPPDAPALRMTGICKAYPGVVALDNVDLEVRAGEVHVLLGENGAGKSTLMKILSGAVSRDAGSIEVDGRSADINDPRAAHAFGVRAIYQELTLVPFLSAAENIFLGREPRRLPGVIDRRRLLAQTRDALAGLGLQVDPEKPVRELGIAQQQMVEVAKALDDRARLLIMDEPTSALSDREIAELFATIERLTTRGTAVIYISHRLEEVKRIGHRVTVLRDGRRVTTRAVADLPIPEMIRLMANRELAEHFPKRRTPRGGELLRVEGLHRRGVLEDINLTVHRGEVVGIAGLLGAGRTELARAIMGADPRHRGRIFINGAEADVHHPADAIRRRMGFLPEDRKTQGLVHGLCVRDNISLPSLARLARAGVVQTAQERTLARQYVKDLRIKTSDVEQVVAQLSGGNQQKVVLAKWLAASADVLIMDEPTRGIDVGAKVEIYELMNDLTARGAGVLMISSELPEILGMSDRILVMRLGRLVAAFDRDEATQERILEAALGHAA
jgi:ribose transport system ATP-binding protein